MQPYRWIPSLLSLALFACGGGGGVVIEGTSSSSSLENEEGVDEVLLTIGEIHAHVAGKGGKHREGDEEGSGLEWKTKHGNWKAASLDQPVTVDLMDLHQRGIVLADLDLPEGKITQIRLFLDEDGRNEVVRRDGSACPIRIPSANQTGIKIAKPFKAIEVGEDEEVRVVIDFNLKKSVKKEGSCSYKLDPVFKVRTRS